MKAGSLCGDGRMPPTYNFHGMLVRSAEIGKSSTELCRCEAVEKDASQVPDQLSHTTRPPKTRFLSRGSVLRLKERYQC
eukprot:2933510-Amphidinium_carterae.2